MAKDEGAKGNLKPISLKLGFSDAQGIKKQGRQEGWGRLLEARKGEVVGG